MRKKCALNRKLDKPKSRRENAVNGMQGIQIQEKNLVYKYRHKKPKLWVRLEKKY
jgi:hypothetical protein